MIIAFRIKKDGTLGIVSEATFDMNLRTIRLKCSPVKLAFVKKNNHIARVQENYIACTG